MDSIVKKAGIQLAADVSSAEKEMKIKGAAQKVYSYLEKNPGVYYSYRLLLTNVLGDGDRVNKVYWGEIRSELRRFPKFQSRGNRIGTTYGLGEFTRIATPYDNMIDAVLNHLNEINRHETRSEIWTAVFGPDILFDQNIWSVIRSSLVKYHGVQVQGQGGGATLGVEGAKERSAKEIVKKPKPKRVRPIKSVRVNSSAKRELSSRQREIVVEAILADPETAISTFPESKTLYRQVEGKILPSKKLRAEILRIIEAAKAGTNQDGVEYALISVGLGFDSRVVRLHLEGLVVNGLINRRTTGKKEVFVLPK